MAELQKALEDIYKEGNLTEYYSGNNVDVFFDNIYVDECTSFGYRSVINSAPTYAYNQTKFNSVAAGTFRVEGKFSINFKATGYLEHILVKGDEQRANGGYKPLGRIGATETARGVRTTSVDRVMQLNSKDFLNTALFNPRATQLNDSELQTVKAKLRDYIWGHLYAQDQADIQSLRDAMVGKYFDILMLIGNPNTDSYDVKNIVDAQILDVSFEIVKSMPLQLVYTFIARDIDRPSSRPDPFEFIKADMPTSSSLQLDPFQFLEYLVGLIELFTEKNMWNDNMTKRFNLAVDADPAFSIFKSANIKLTTPTA